MPKKLDLDKKEIIRLYLKKKISAYKIAKKFNCDVGPIYRILKENKIKLFPHGFFIRDKPSWNKCLTKETNEKLRKSGLKGSRTRKRLIKEKKIKIGFQKGHKIWLGKHLSEKHKEKLRETTKKVWKDNPKYRKKMLDVLGDARKKITEESIEKIRKKNLGKHFSPKTEFKKSDPRICGKNSHNWQGGISFEPYGTEFNKELKEKIRKRDNYTCQECGKNQEEVKKKLDVHHIDYNKKNNSPFNLISLCNSCHSKTNKDRKHWTNYFQMKMFIREFFNPENLLIFKDKKLIGMSKIE